MKASITRITLWLFAAAFLLTGFAVGQRKPAPPKPIIFAVVNDGKWIEPIGVVDEGKITAVTDESEDMKAFGRNYYKPKTFYALIFGGANEGLATVVKSNIGSECGGGSADVTVKSAKAKLVSPVFALATNLKLKPGTTSYRRRPTPQERAAIEGSVRAEFIKNGASAEDAKTLRYHNLIAVDVDGDRDPEFVGSYWIAPKPDERRLLFFVFKFVPDNAKVLISLDHSVVTTDDVMSGDLKDVDKGYGAELLLDVLDYDGDGVKELFTIGQAFEGNNYYVYKRDGVKWVKVHETYVYRCAF